MQLTLSVREIVAVTARVCAVRLDLEGRRFEYEPGQAVMLRIAAGASPRAYSLAAAPEDAARHGCLELLIGIDHPATAGLLSMGAGALVDVDGPIGGFTFPARPKERRFVFIAGGTGIAPLRAMVRRALTVPHREIVVIYSARTPSDFAYDDELSGLARGGRIQLRQTVTRCAAADSWNGWRGRLGRSQLHSLVTGDPTLWFLCGPAAFVTETADLLEELGAPREQIKMEQWLSRPANPASV